MYTRRSFLADAAGVILRPRGQRASPPRPSRRRGCAEASEAGGHARDAARRGRSEAGGEEIDAGPENNQPAERCDDVGYSRLPPDDIHGLDIDREFGGFLKEDDQERSLRKPANWRRAIDLASEVLLDEMRTLLETVYTHLIFEYPSSQPCG